ncbi:MAG: kinase [Sandaracinaceae bacterium]|nr:kinase [Sandaracinaceae bacterium]
MTPTARAALEEAALAATQASAVAVPEGPARERFARELLAPIANAVLAQHARGARVIGVYGAQGSGKTTLASSLAQLLRAHAGLNAVALSLDDFYLTRAHRLRVAARLHPLFATRGVPGTHDIPLLLRTVDALLAPGPHGDHEVAVPRFDKAQDDRAPTALRLRAPVDVVILEGWCLGVPAEPPERLLIACNALETAEDPGGRFRRCVNHRLAHDYATLARRVDWLLALMVESFEVSCAQRLEQEHVLRATGRGGMSDVEVSAFMQRFERVTRWALCTMSERADLSVALDAAHGPRAPLPWV